MARWRPMSVAVLASGGAGNTAPDMLLGEVLPWHEEASPAPVSEHHSPFTSNTESRGWNMATVAARSLAPSKTRGKKAAEVGFERLKLPPRNTHGILGGVTSLAFPLKLVFPSLLIGTWARSRAVRVSEQEIQRRRSPFSFSRPAGGLKIYSLYFWPILWCINSRYTHQSLCFLYVFLSFAGVYYFQIFLGSSCHSAECRVI